MELRGLWVVREDKAEVVFARSALLLSHAPPRPLLSGPAQPSFSQAPRPALLLSSPALTPRPHAPPFPPCRRYTNVEMRFRAAYPDTWEAAALPTDEDLARRAVAAWKSAEGADLEDSVCFHLGTLWPAVMIAEVRAPAVAACRCCCTN